MMLASPTAFPPSSSSSEDPLTALIRSPTPRISISFSSCSQEASMATFDWSDFPAVVDSSVNLIRSPPSFSPLSSSSSLSALPSVHHHQQPQQHVSYFYSTQEVKPRTTIKVTQLQQSQQPQSQQNRRFNFPQPKIPSISRNAVSTTSAPSILATTTAIHKRSHSSSSSKHVRFSSTIQIRTHAVTLGDHPLCSGGMAMTSDWMLARDDETVDLDEYEASSRKRRQGDLRLSFAQRRDCLQDALGLSASELLQKEYELIFGWNPCWNLHPSPSVRRALAAARGWSDEDEEEAPMEWTRKKQGSKED